MLRVGMLKFYTNVQIILWMSKYSNAKTALKRLSINCLTISYYFTKRHSYSEVEMCCVIYCLHIKHVYKLYILHIYILILLNGENSIRSDLVNYFLRWGTCIRNEKGSTRSLRIAVMKYYNLLCVLWILKWGIRR